MRALSFPLLLSLFTISCGGSSSSGEPTANDSLATPSNVRVIGISRRVAMLEVLLVEEETFDAPPSRCQDTMMLVKEGEIRIAPEGDQEAILRTRDAMRLGGTRPATARGTSPARVLVVVTRPADAPFDSTRGLAAVYHPPRRCGHGAATRFERSSPATSGPFTSAAGKLRVSIFLDGRAAGGAISSLGLLEGTADVAVPRHAHEISDEVLFIESGDGTMTLGDDQMPVHGPQFVWVPAGMPHSLARSGDAPLLAYQVYAPAGPEQRFRTPSAP